MKERPILFSAPMVRAILAGTKTVTRRVVKPQPEPFVESARRHAQRHAEPYIDSYCSEPKTPSNPRGMSTTWCWWTTDDRQGPGGLRCPYGAPGDRLWVRETWGLHGYGDYTYWHRDSVRGRTEDDLRGSWEVAYAADALSPYDHWRPSIYMPRWASRITLEVVDVRVERLHEITEGDARREGAEKGFTAEEAVDRAAGWPRAASHRAGFRALWESINGAGSWASNPWVWRIAFRRLP